MEQYPSVKAPKRTNKAGKVRWLIDAEISKLEK